jgi:folate-binding protein YgfZ
MEYTKLPNRGLVTVSGEDRRVFLQGLVSNDVALLDSQPCVYACLLTPQGKFLHDFFITESEGVLRLECEGGARVQDLFRRLSLYKLRADVTLRCEEEICVYSLSQYPPPLSSPPAAQAATKNVKGGGLEGGNDIYSDPRHAEMGQRYLFHPPETITEKPFSAWDQHRICLGIPDGSRDMIVEKDTLLDCNIDRLNGISWTKGCYVGQEITARMNYRALVKKRLTPVRFASTPPPFGAIITDDTGNDIGEMRSSQGQDGLVMLKEGAILPKGMT